MSSNRSVDSDTLRQWAARCCWKSCPVRPLPQRAGHLYVSRHGSPSNRNSRRHMCCHWRLGRSFHSRKVARRRVVGVSGNAHQRLARHRRRRAPWRLQQPGRHRNTRVRKRSWRHEVRPSLAGHHFGACGSRLLYPVQVENMHAQVFSGVVTANPSIEATNNGGQRSSAFATAVPPLFAPHLQR